MMSGRGGSVKDCRESCSFCRALDERIRSPAPHAGRRCCDGLACRNRGRAPWPRSDATSARGATREAGGASRLPRVVDLLVSIAAEAVDEVLERLLAARDGLDVDVGGQHLVGEFGE